jgi:hypothetical protein
MTKNHDDKIEELLREADECELLGGLAVDRDIRLTNRKRANQLRRLAAEHERRCPEAFIECQ